MFEIRSIHLNNAIVDLSFKSNFGLKEKVCAACNTHKVQEDFVGYVIAFTGYVDFKFDGESPADPPFREHTFKFLICKDCYEKEKVKAGRIIFDENNIETQTQIAQALTTDPHTRIFRLLKEMFFQSGKNPIALRVNKVFYKLLLRKAKDRDKAVTRVRNILGIPVEIYPNQEQPFILVTEMCLIGDMNVYFEVTETSPKLLITMDSLKELIQELC